jgi:dephospho-CoA kinase
MPPPERHDPERPASQRPAQRGSPSLVVGVLGGIASGKSAAAALLAGPGGVVIDADRIAREVLEEPRVRAELERAFGPGVLGPGGAPDRAALARLAFADPAARARLESLTHPPVRARVRALLDAARARGVPMIVLDVPLLLENDAQHGLVGECDTLVFVEAAPALREARARAARGWTEGEVARREAAQMPLAAKRARADHVLANEAGPAELAREAARVLGEIERARAARTREPGND